MKRAILLAVAICALALFPASAQLIVDYSLLGSFDGGPASSNPSLTFGSGGNTVTIQYTGYTNEVTAPSFISGGTLQTFVTGTGATVPGGTTFSLFIYQSNPATDLGVLNGTVSGTISTNSSNGVILFGANSITLSDNIDWSIPFGGSAWTVFQSSIGPVSTNFQVDGVPEPDSILMLVGGIGLLGVATRRRAVKRT